MKGLERFIGTVLDEKYRLESLLGKGGMGAVFFATHLGTERPVALKIIAPQFMQNSEFVERFKREARAAGRLRHPNVVDVTDFGFAHVGAERVAYLVMEYLDGCTLADVLAEEKRLPLDWVVDIIEQTCSAVDEAHQQGVVHRDLKPDNIWLEPTRLGGYRVKVLDFGIAKLADSGISGDEEAAQFGNAPTLTDFTLPTRAGVTVSTAETLPPRDTALGEAATQFFPATTNAVGNAQNAADDAQATRMFEPQVVPQTLRAEPPASESDTQMLPATQILPATPRAAHDAGNPGDADKTQLLEQTTGRDIRSRAASTDAAAFGVTTASVTRVGAILGTPLYMSPEQCRGEQLDARSDIYSLGVITYQMLAGETPFDGEPLAILSKHDKEVPPALRLKNRKVPKKVAGLVMSALSKQPSERPANAAAFADALHANSDGLGTLLRRAFALYSEHFPKFLRLSLMAYAPLIVLILLNIVFDALRLEDSLPLAVKIIAAIVFGILNFVANYLAAAVISGVTVLLVIQMSLAPLRPISLREAFVVLRKRWRPFLRTSIRVFVRVMLGFLLFIIPAFIVMYRYTLYAPVVLAEGLEKSAALKRARELSRRARWTVIAVVLLHLFLPMLIGGIVGSNAAGKKDGGGGVQVSRESLSLLSPLVNVILTPLFSITTALLYLKTRRMGGETMKGTLEQFDDGDAPRSKWQQRMRERLNLPTRTSRS